MNNCPNCRCYRRITEIKFSDPVVLTPDNMWADPMEPFNWVIQRSYCSPQPTAPVEMVLNDVLVPLWDIYGRPVYSDQIKCRTMYKSRYVEEGTPHLTVLNLCLEGALCPRTTPPVKMAVHASAPKSTSKKE